MDDGQQPVLREHIQAYAQDRRAQQQHARDQQVFCRSRLRKRHAQQEQECGGVGGRENPDFGSQLIRHVHVARMDEGLDALVVGQEPG
jgi:hypothetical protein